MSCPALCHATRSTRPAEVDKSRTRPDIAAILRGMRITRVLAAAVMALAALPAAVAGQAQADPAVLQGIYTYTQGDVVAEWTIYPSCVPTVGDLRDNLELPVACRLHVAPSSINLVNGGDARMTGGEWAFSTVRGDVIKCSDGS